MIRKKSKAKTREPTADKEAKTYTPQTEWIKNRLRDRGITIEAACIELGTYKQMYHRVLAGTRPARPIDLLIFSRLLDLTLAETFRRFGYPEARASKVPVIGRVNAAGAVTLVSPQDVTEVDSPLDCSSDTRAVIVEAPNSSLASYDGAILYFEPVEDLIALNALGRLSYLKFAGTATPYIGVPTRLPSRGHRISILGARDPITSEDLKSAAPITWIRSS